NSCPDRTASTQRPSVTQPAAARYPTLPKGLICPRIAGGDTRSIPNRARARAMAQAEYHRRRSIARGTTSTTAPQGTLRKRRHGTVSVAGVPPASVGPSIHRVRSPCPCSRKLAPAGRLAAWHPGHCFGRTSSGDGGLASHLLTSSSLCTIRLGPRSLSAIQPGATMGTVLRAPVPITISGAETIPAPRPPPSAAAHYITAAGRLQAPSLMARPSPLVRPAIRKSARSPRLPQQSARAVTEGSDKRGVPRQAQLSLPTPARWGGRRRGAGRKLVRARRTPAHRTRPAHE